MNDDGSPSTKRAEHVFFAAATALMLAMLLYIAALLAVIASETEAFFEVLAAFLVGALLTGLAVLWGVYRFQQIVRQKARRETIGEARRTLSDVVKNRLTVVTLRLQKYQRQREGTYLEQARAEIREIAEWIDSLSKESIEEWKRQYEEAAPEK